MSRLSCPTCGGPMRHAPPEIFEVIPKPSETDVIVFELLFIYPNGISVEALANAVWPRGNKRPRDYRNAIRCYITRLRRKISGKYTIFNYPRGRSSDGFYRLEAVE